MCCKIAKDGGKPRYPKPKPKPISILPTAVPVVEEEKKKSSKYRDIDEPWGE
jgi:hypothetical protein